MREVKSFLTAITLLVTIACGHAEAGVLFAVTGAGGASSNLYTVDTITGTTSLVGATGFSHVTGLAFDPTTGQLYGHVSDLFDTGDTDLLRIDSTTGLGTLIGSTGIQTPDLAFDSSGQLYAWSEGSSTTSNFDDLHRIDKMTGAATFVGEAGISTQQTGLGFDNLGNLFVKSGDEVFSIDTLTGLATATQTLSTILDNALAFDPMSSLAFGIDRRSGSTFLQQVDFGSGAVTEIGNMGVSGISALAFQPQTNPAVPEPSSLAIFGVMGLVGCGIRRRRSKRTA